MTLIWCIRSGLACCMYTVWLHASSKIKRALEAGGSGNEAIKRTRDKIMIYSIPHDAPGA